MKNRNKNRRSKQTERTRIVISTNNSIEWENRIEESSEWKSLSSMFCTLFARFLSSSLSLIGKYIFDPDGDHPSETIIRQYRGIQNSWMIEPLSTAWPLLTALCPAKIHSIWPYCLSDFSGQMISKKKLENIWKKRGEDAIELMLSIRALYSSSTNK